MPTGMPRPSSATVQVGVDLHQDRLAVPGQRLVDGVVDDLIDEMVQPARVVPADVHARAGAHVLNIGKHLDVVLCIALTRQSDGLRGRVLIHEFLLLVCCAPAWFPNPERRAETSALIIAIFDPNARPRPPDPACSDPPPGGSFKPAPIALNPAPRPYYNDTEQIP
jgi:hypothetical protein